MGVYLPLPSEYQEVEYIQSSGTQYIILGNSFKTSYKAVIDFQMTVIGGDYIPLGIKYSTKRYGIDAYNSKFMVNGGGETWTNTISEDTNRHTITIDKGTARVDGNNYSVSYTNYTFSQGIGVFCYNEYDKSPQYTYKSSNKLYKLDIYDENGSHIYDIVPCYRKSDNEIGLYDLVNNQFYTNSGTGTFSKGADVTAMPLKNAYIGGYHEYEYTYDFTTGSTSDLQSKGWTVPTGSVVNSNGYYNSSKNWNAMTITPTQLQTAVQTATKVIYWLSWTASGTQQRTFALASGSTEICYLYGDGESPSGGNQASFGQQILVNESGHTYGGSGTFTTTVTVDLENKTRQYEGTNHTTLTGTVTDTAIASFRTVYGLRVYGERLAYITGIGVKIIY